MDIRGEITGSAEEALWAIQRAVDDSVKTIVLNITQVPAIDSRGAGLLVVLLARVRRQGQQLLAWGLNDPCRRALELTHLASEIGLYSDESAALGRSPESLPAKGHAAPAG